MFFCVWYKKAFQFDSYTYSIQTFSTPFIGMLSFSHCIFLPSLLWINSPHNFKFITGPSVLLYQSVCFFPVSHIFDAVALWYSLKSWCTKSLALFSHLSWLKYKFKNYFSKNNLLKSAIDILIEITLNLYIASGTVNI